LIHIKCSKKKILFFEELMMAEVSFLRGLPVPEAERVGP
jgi:hypothetical protein